MPPPSNSVPTDDILSCHDDQLSHIILKSHEEGPSNWPNMKMFSLLPSQSLLAQCNLDLQACDMVLAHDHSFIKMSIYAI